MFINEQTNLSRFVQMSITSCITDTRKLVLFLSSSRLFTYDSIKFKGLIRDVR